MKFVSKESLTVAGVSLGIHLSLFAALSYQAAQFAAAPRLKQVTVKIKEIKKPEVPAPTVAPQPPEPKKEKIPPKQNTEKKLPPKKDVEIVQGFDKNNLSPDSKGPAVAVGNTLMTEDKGIRKDDVEQFQGDMSSDAILEKSSVPVPKYTSEAVDVRLEGFYIVDVFVNEKGEVTEAELRKKIGFDMDERVLEAARKARFKPRKNKVGQAIAGWTEIKFKLEIP